MTSPENEYSNAQIETLVCFSNLGELLSGCIVETEYKPPVPLTSSIVFTRQGNRLANQIKGSGIELREAHLSTFISLFSNEGALVDVDETDLQTIQGYISSELKKNRLKLPWVYGRKLYDRLASMPFYGTAYPTFEETKKLLQGLPQGVFQHGPYVAGPYGLLTTSDWRYIPTTRTVPAYHCEELDCGAVHRLYLATGDSGVSRGNRAIRDKMVDGSSKLQDDVARVILDMENSKFNPFSWHNSSRLPFFLFDCLSPEQLSVLTTYLLDNTKGRLRNACEQISLEQPINSSEDFVNKLSDAELCQVILLARDSDIHAALNILIWNEKISIPFGERRSPQIVRSGSGALNVQIEASELGVRYHPPKRILQVRLQGIIDSIFPDSDQESQTRLRWLLREHEGETAREKLNSSLAKGDPQQVASRLLVSDERAFKQALEELGLPEHDLLEKSDEYLSRLIAWHIGFPVHTKDQQLETLRMGVTHLRQTVQSFSSEKLERADIDKLRSLAGSLFPDLEQTLKQTLYFVAWSLISDHYSNTYSLQYSPHQGQDFFVRWLSDQDHGLTTTSAGDMSLSELLTCFGVLTKYLMHINSDSSKYVRSDIELPKGSRYGNNPFVFPFRHQYAFLDLEERSKSSIIDFLRRTSSRFHENNVVLVRNKFHHHTEEFPDRATINAALNEIDAFITELSSMGLYPRVFIPGNASEDIYGRKWVRLSGSEGEEVVLARPSNIDLVGFPALSDEQIIISCAILKGSSEPLRFASYKDSDYRKKWTDFPKRPQRKHTGRDILQILNIDENA